MPRSASSARSTGDRRVKVAVIGSGQAAVSAAEELVERGVKPVVLDVGETLPAENRARAERLAATPPEEWPEGAAEFPASVRVGAIPDKAVFGSDYLFAAERPFAPVRHDGTTAVPSFAKGGFSIGWGAAALPARAEDLDAWPFPAERLVPFYAKAAKTMVVDGGDPVPDAPFPLPEETRPTSHMTDQGRRLLEDLNRASTRLARGRDRLRFGAARLFVDRRNCRRCGVCLTGCPYGLIFTADLALDRLFAAGAIHYQPSAYVTAIRETADGATVEWMDVATGDFRSETFDRVFLGAGALGSARIVLNSLKAYDVSVPVKDSAKFLVPIVRLRGADFEWPAVNTLADLFVEAVFPGVSNRWLHVQISPLNEVMLGMLHLRRGLRLNPLGRLARPLTGRLMAAWCGMHSDLSPECRVSVSAGERGLPVLHVRSDTGRAPSAVGAYARRLAGKGLAFGTLFAFPMTMVFEPCKTGHCGGSFPMREAPAAPFETDTLGRPAGWRHTHLVDPSAFPSVPGSTIALLIRANARRIVAEILSAS